MGIDVAFFKNSSFSHSLQAGLTTLQNSKRRKKCKARKEASHFFSKKINVSLYYLAASYQSVFYFVAL